jgi:UDP-N-acetylmuramoyl-tripeptide--D-alanyl-D-alanine ligase
MARTLSAVARAVDGRLTGADAAFDGVTTDTRALAQGALFVAIVGDRFDGNDFVPDAQAKGAAGALVSRLAGSPLAQVGVADTRVAFGRMARAWRQNFSIPAVAVTGSAGKTTVKQLVAGILGVGRRVCVTHGNLNNDIGVPLTLMRLGPEDQALVVELGANHAGEIGYLAELAQPTVGVITNAGAAHLEGFGSVAGVAAAKGELLDHLPRAGTAVLNADDPYCAEWRARARAEFVVTFGRSDAADCHVVGTPTFANASSHFALQLPDGNVIDVTLPLLGATNILNALAAAAAAHAAGAPAADVRAGLERAQPVTGRLTALRAKGGATVIDDSYNANPASMRAALDYMAQLGGRRIVVLGDMAELGPEAAELHRQIGEYARARCDELLVIGTLARHAVAAFGPGALAFDDLDDLENTIAARVAGDVTVLIKGSRVMGLERLVRALAPGEEGGTPCS